MSVYERDRYECIQMRKSGGKEEEMMVSEIC